MPQLPVQTWSGFSSPGMHKTITGNVLTDVTSVMDSGIMLCAGLSAKFKPEWRILVAILPPACWGGAVTRLWHTSGLRLQHKRFF